MISDLLKKEILEHLLSLRLVLAFALVVVLLVASGILFVEDYEAQVNDYTQQVSENSEFVSKNLSTNPFEVLSWGRQRIYRRPHPLVFLAEGREKDLPNSFRVNAFRLEGPDYSLRGNPLLGEFEVLDWSFTIGIVLSFVAILLASDGVNGEKQRGTLRLMLSNPVPRARLLIAKYFSTMILLTIPLLIGAILGLLVITASGQVQLSGQDWAKIGSMAIVSLLYLSVFVVLGLLLSTVLKDPQASLVVALLLWVVLVIVIPSGAALTAKLLDRLPDQNVVLEDANRAFGEAVENHNRRYPHKDNFVMSGQWSPGEPLERAVRAAEAQDRVLFSYDDQKLGQVRFGQDLSRFSPAGLYQSAVLGITGSGIFHYESFLRQSRRYREDLKRFLEGSYAFGKNYPNMEGRDQISSGIKMSYDSVPKFQEQLLSVQEGWANAIWDTGLLALLNVILFAGCWALFVRYDAR